MPDSFYFNGEAYTTPTVVSAVNDSAMAPSNLTTGNVLALLGLCTSGQPLKVYRFGDPSDVTAALGSGPLCTAAIKAFNPSNETNAPNLVICVPVGEATGSTVTLNDTRGDPSVILQAVPYGVAGNGIKVTVDAGTTTDTLIVEVGQGQSYFVSPNLGGDLFSVAYTGIGTLPGIAYLKNQITASYTSGGKAVTNVLNFVSTTAVQDVVNWLNAIPGFTATVLNNSGLQGLYNLVSAGGFAPSAAATNVNYNLDAVLGWLNGNAQSLVTAIAAAPTGQTLSGPAPIGWTYLAGGTAPTATVMDWVNAFTTLQGVDCQWVVPLTSNPAIWAAGDAHVQYMSTVGQRERRQLVGPAAGTTLTQVLAMPITINSDRTSVCWPGYYDFDVNGDLVLYDPFYTAACAAAALSAVAPGTPLTNTAMTFQGIELQVKNPTDTNQLIQAGVMCFDQETTGFDCVRSISTWLVNNNFNRTEVSTGAAVDYMMRSVRSALSPLKGSRGDPLILGRAVAIVTACLTQLAKPPPQGPGVIVGDTVTPAFRNVSASLNGDVLSVQWTASPVIPVNFIPCTAGITIYSGTSSTSTAASAVNTAIAA